MKRLDLCPLTSLRTFSVDMRGAHHVERREAFLGWLAGNIQRFPSAHPLRCLIFNICRPDEHGHFEDLDLWSALDETISTIARINMMFNLSPSFDAEVIADFRNAIKAALPRSDHLGWVSFGSVEYPGLGE